MNLAALCRDFSALRDAVLWRMDRRCRIGWVDHSPLSWDWSQAGAQAYRIQQRVLFGRHLTRQQLRDELCTT